MRKIERKPDRGYSGAQCKTTEPAPDNFLDSQRHFYITRAAEGSKKTEHASIREVQARVEKTAIQRALAEAGYKKTRAADMLGIHRTLLYKKMKKHGIALQPT